MPIEQFLAHYCGPALAGIKTANMASYSKTENPNILSELELLNKSLNSSDIYIDILCECQERVLILVYRYKQLCQYLNSPEIRALLLEYGYPARFSLHTYLEILKERMRCGRGGEAEFPHEIGAFLGYPPHDIYGFIHHKEQYLFAGEWKVYAEAETAVKSFRRYKACRSAIKKRLYEGKTLQDLFCRT